MATDSSAEFALMPAIAALHERAGEVRDQLASAGDAELAELVAAWPETRALNAAAGVVARTRGYLHYDDDGVDDHWGRRLTRNNPRALGVLDVLRVRV